MERTGEDPSMDLMLNVNSHESEAIPSRENAGVCGSDFTRETHRS
jgi:hypothetical protein